MRILIPGLRRGTTAAAEAGPADAEPRSGEAANASEVRRASSNGPTDVLELASPGGLVARGAQAAGRGAEALVRDYLGDIKEFGIAQLTNGRWIGPRIDLADGLRLGLRLRERFVRSSDPAIQKDALKTATTKQLQAEGKDVFWFESGGLAELGFGLNGTIPLPVLDLGVVTGFDTRAMVLYRAFKPYAVQGSLPEGALDGVKVARDLVESTALPLPLTPTGAAALAPGAEFEIVGRGLFNAKAGLAYNRAPGFAFGRPRVRNIGPNDLSVIARTDDAVFSLGPRLDATLDGTLTGELSLKITGIDGKRLVRVTLSRLASAAGSARLTAAAGIFLKTTTPNGDIARLFTGDNGDPVVKPIAEAVEDFLADHLGASAYFDVGIRAQDEVLDAFVLDLDRPEARDAFEALVRLAPGRARALAVEENTGVTEAKLDARSLAFSNEISVRAFGQQLLLRQALAQSSTARYDGPDGAWAIEHGATFTKKLDTVLGGQKTITWEALSLGTSEVSEPLTYYHLTLENKDKITKSRQLERLYDFAHVVEGQPVVELRDPPPVAWWKRPFTPRDNSTVKVDLYFTPEGIRRIDAAGRREGVSAYLGTLASFDPYFEGHPALADAMSADVERLLRRATFVDRVLGPFDPCVPCATATLEAAYFDATGRSLRRDERAARVAEAFGARIEGLVAGERSAETFFTHLGKSRGFAFYEAVAALARLAGDDATVVHALSIKGEGLRFEARDEGRVVRFSPQAMARNLMPTGPASGATLAQPVLVERPAT